jgi:hypothetical protein
MEHSKGFLKWVVLVPAVCVVLGAVFGYGLYRGIKGEVDRGQTQRIGENKAMIDMNRESIHKLDTQQQVTNRFLEIYKPEIFNRAVEDVENGHAPDTVRKNEYSTDSLPPP